MKLFTSIILVLASLFLNTGVAAQNVSINLLTLNSGLVALNGTVFLQVDINNTDPGVSVPVYKLRPQISVPISIVNLPATGHILPPGWSITFNNGTVMRLSNGTDEVPAGEVRTLLISIQGNVIGGPQPVSGNLLFSNGVAPGSASGGATPGDNPADNVSSSTIQVYDPVPLTLIDFNARFLNCQSELNWTTENEINSDRFEIETSKSDNTNWLSIGTVGANGSNSSKTAYKFTDRNVPVSSGYVLYRLKMIDKDGRYKYSNSIPVYTNCKNIESYVYPNPVQDGRLYVSLTGTTGITEATLLSISGQLISKNLMNNGTNYINVASIPNGVYILHINNGNDVDRKVKILIQQ